jgi:hypothetical protein
MISPLGRQQGVASKGMDRETTADMHITKLGESKLAWTSADYRRLDSSTPITECSTSNWYLAPPC